MFFISSFIAPSRANSSKRAAIAPAYRAYSHVLFNIVSPAAESRTRLCTEASSTFTAMTNVAAPMNTGESAECSFFFTMMHSATGSPTATSRENAIHAMDAAGTGARGGIVIFSCPFFNEIHMLHIPYYHTV